MNLESWKILNSSRFCEIALLHKSDQTYEWNWLIWMDCTRVWYRYWSTIWTLGLTKCITIQTCLLAFLAIQSYSDYISQLIQGGHKLTIQIDDLCLEVVIIWTWLCFAHGGHRCRWQRELCRFVIGSTTFQEMVKHSRPTFAFCSNEGKGKYQCTPSVQKSKTFGKNGVCPEI